MMFTLQNTRHPEASPLLKIDKWAFFRRELEGLDRRLEEEAEYKRLLPLRDPSIICPSSPLTSSGGVFLLRVGLWRSGPCQRDGWFYNVANCGVCLSVDTDETLKNCLFHKGLLKIKSFIQRSAASALKPFSQTPT